MEWNDRIVYSQDQMLLSLEAGLDRLNRVKYDGHYAAALGESFMADLTKWEADIRRRKEDPFTLVVIGNFKRGKSTLINALLGEDAAATDVTTETVTLNRLRYGPHQNRAVLSGSRQLTLEDRELKRAALQEVLARAGEPVTRLEISRPNEFLKKVTIIDTPGTEDAQYDFSSLVSESLYQADAVICVYNVLYPLSRAEQLFLRSSVLSRPFTRLFLVGNFADSLENADNYDRVRQMLAERTGELLPQADVIMVSALNERCRQLGKDRPCPALAPLLDREFDALRDALNHLVSEKADTVMVDRMQRLTAAMADSLEETLSAQERGLSMSLDEAAKERAAAREEKEQRARAQQKLLETVDEKTAAMKREAQRWMLDFTARIAREAETLNTQDINDLTKYYECYCLDLLTRALDTCLDVHREALCDELDGLMRGLGSGFMARTAREQNYSFRIRVTNRIWTKADSAGLVVSQAAQLVPLVGNLALNGIMGSARAAMKKNKTADVAGQIAAQMTALTASVSQTVIRVYDALAEQAKQLAMEEYRAKTEEEDSLLQQTWAAAAREEEEKEASRRTIAEVRALLRDLRETCV